MNDQEIVVHTHTTEFYSTAGNNDMWFEGKLIRLEDITLSEVSQAQKHKGCMFSLMWETDPKINIYTKQA
jgi:hypothetical protein